MLPNSILGWLKKREVTEKYSTIKSLITHNPKKLEGTSHPPRALERTNMNKNMVEMWNKNMDMVELQCAGNLDVKTHKPADALKINTIYIFINTK